MNANQSFLLEIVEKLRQIHLNTCDGETSIEIDELIDFILQAVE